MIILISPEQDIDHEIEILHQLFKAGLQYFHFRKPQASLEAHKVYLDQVEVKYHKYIMTHNYHKELCAEYTLKGIHLEEAKWRAQGENLKHYIQQFKDKEFTVSSSYHEPEDLIAQSASFDYTILSPVFAAISKSDMQGRGFDVRAIDKLVVGMGGINADTTPEAIALGFKGVGALGGVWNSESPLEAFVTMSTVFERAMKKRK